MVKSLSTQSVLVFLEMAEINAEKDPSTTLSGHNAERDRVLDKHRKEIMFSFIATIYIYIYVCLDAVRDRPRFVRT